MYPKPQNLYLFMTHIQIEQLFFTSHVTTVVSWEIEVMVVKEHFLPGLISKVTEAQFAFIKYVYDQTVTSSCHIVRTKLTLKFTCHSQLHISGQYISI